MDRDSLSDNDEAGFEDWYCESDTSENLPDPNESEDHLYQEENKLPIPLRKNHFREGIVYSMALCKKPKVSILVMVIHANVNTFLYRVFFTSGSSRKSYHEGAKDKRAKYTEVLRLAPRNQLIRPRHPTNARTGETLRFEYEDQTITGLLIKRNSRELTCMIVCGKCRGETKVFEVIEVINCHEVFGSPILQGLLKSVKNTSWAESKTSKTKETPTALPKLQPAFMCPEPIKYKRL